MKRIIIVFLALFHVVLLYPQEVFSIESIHANPGEKVSGKLIIKEGIDEGTFIPLTIINGKNPGPVLSLTAGMHGTEYVPVIALQELINEIDPNDLSGTLVMVHVANIPAFLNRSVYLSAPDQKNLNRIFPGKQDGTVSERIASVLFNEIILKSDYYIDLHGGEFNERLVNFLYFFYGCPDGDLCEKSILMAHAMGNNYLIPFKYDENFGSSSTGPAIYKAFRSGIPSILAEFGDQGKVAPEELESVMKGLINVMRSTGMLEGETFRNEHPLYLSENLIMKSKYDGIFKAFVDKGLSVSQGTLLGYTSDYWGNILEEYRAPFSGVIARTTSAPMVRNGEVVIRLSKVSDTY